MIAAYADDDTSDAAIAYAIAADHAAYGDQARGDALKDEHEAALEASYRAAEEADWADQELPDDDGGAS
mgnify:FL=1